MTYGVTEAQLREEMETFLTGVVGVVDANSYETLCLWNEHQGRGTWKANLSGLLEVVGQLADMPVALSLNTAEINGHKILFIDATSQVVDHRQIDEWLKTTLPPTAFRENGYVNRTNAMNFHNVFPRSTKATP